MTDTDEALQFNNPCRRPQLLFPIAKSGGLMMDYRITKALLVAPPLKEARESVIGHRGLKKLWPGIR